MFTQELANELRDHINTTTEQKLEWVAFEQGSKNIDEWGFIGGTEKTITEEILEGYKNKIVHYSLINWGLLPKYIDKFKKIEAHHLQSILLLDAELYCDWGNPKQIEHVSTVIESIKIEEPITETPDQIKEE